MTTFVFKVDRGGKIQVLFQAGHHRPASETPLKAFRWHADECPTLNASLAAAIFRGSGPVLLENSIFCDFSVWGSGPGSAHVISRYFGTYNVRQRLRRACASVHFQYSIDGSGMSSITAFMLNGSLILCLETQTTTWKMALLYISLYKQTYLVNLLSCLTLRFAWLF